ncbi:hypothetical protein NPIL_562601 [Nephila pilipes]|uniref:Uncharacterized protein n=1 Tax=Nephila pilipes TaxID=299642 RepID=A0A8X6NUA3_NEPPI|nr:hypothetical protein NPIL_562601 [Nephila pilipes]
MQNSKAILYLLIFRTPQNTVSHGKKTQCRLSAAKLARKPKPPYFHVLVHQSIQIALTEKILELPVSKPTRSKSIYKLHDCFKHGFHIQCRLTQSILTCNTTYKNNIVPGIVLIKESKKSRFFFPVIFGVPSVVILHIFVIGTFKFRIPS